MISIVIPVYNEQETLPTLYQRLTKALAKLDVDYEVVVVNDGSSDATAALLDTIHQEDPRWKVIAFSRNFGHQAAVSAGIQYSRGQAIAIMDADLQDPPELLEPLLAKWREGFQVIYAVRTERKEHVFKRAAYALFYRLLQRLASIDIPLDSGDFCLLDRRVAEVLKSMPERTRFVRGLRSWAGFRQIGIPYERDARQAGKPKYNLTRLVRLAFDGIVSFSHAPLRLASWLGIAFCGLSMMLVLSLCLWWLSGQQILGMHPRNCLGWTSLISVMLLLTGIQMSLIGVFGEYLSRIFDEVKGRPLWVVARAPGFEDVPEIWEPAVHENLRDRTAVAWPTGGEKRHWIPQTLGYSDQGQEDASIV